MSCIPRCVVAICLMQIVHVYGETIHSAVDRLIQDPKEIIKENQSIYNPKLSRVFDRFFEEEIMEELVSEDDDDEYLSDNESSPCENDDISCISDDNTYTREDDDAYLREEISKHPLCMFRECAFLCPMGLGRLDGKEGEEHRSVFEQYVQQCLSTYKNTYEDTLRYVSFGSGGMLQDLVILSRFLKEHADASLDIHLIDYNYRYFIQCCFDDANIAEGQQSLCIDPHTDYMEYGNMSLVGVAYTPAQYLLTTLQAIAPSASLRVCIHADIASYHNYTRSENIARPTIATAIDLGERQDSTWTFLHLCHNIMQSNQDAIGVCMFFAINLLKTITPDRGCIDVSSFYLHNEGYISDEQYRNDRHVYMNLTLGVNPYATEEAWKKYGFSYVIMPAIKGIAATYDRMRGVYKWATV